LGKLLSCLGDVYCEIPTTDYAKYNGLKKCALYRVAKTHRMP